ncbi:MAG: efflux RND transporter permease subunit [Chloroflexota bacterium]
MGLTRLAVKRPITITMLILALVLMGGVAYTKLQVSRFPRVNFPVVSIRIGYPGASAQDVEQLVTKPIETAMNGLSGVSDIFSTSREGQSSVTVQLSEDADVNQAALDISRKVASIQSRLPADITPPDVIKADSANFPIMNIALSGSLPLDQLYNLANDTVAPRIQSLPGVAQVTLVGGLRREVQVQVDPVKVQAYGLTLLQVQAAMAADNLTSPGGTVRQGLTQYSVRTSALFTRLDQFSDIVVSSGPAGNVRLKDIAEIKDTYANQTNIQRFNGNPSIGLSIVQQSDANTVQVVERVRAEMARLQRTLPRGIVFNVANDSSRFTKAAIDAVEFDLGLAVLLCGRVILVFLHAWRNTLIVLLAIPTSLISTLLVMYFMGFSLNTISLLALAILIGILVDDSIVVLENIHRHLKLGDEPVLAALKGRSEIGMAAIAITLVDVVVFLPIAFMSGTLGQIFREFGLTIVVATLFSLFISFTLTPMLAAHWLKPEKVDEVNRRVRRGLLAPFRGFGEWSDNTLDAVRQLYRRTLGWALSHRPLVLLGAAVAFGVAIAFIPLNLLGSEFAPTEDDNQFSLQVRMPSGSSLEATSRAMVQLEGRLDGLPEVRDVFSSVGVGGGGSGGQAAFGNMTVQLVDKQERTRTTLAVLEEVRGIGRTIPGMTLTGNVQSSFGGGSPVSLRILGDDLSTLAGIADQVMVIVRNTPGTTDVRLEQDAGVPEVQAVLDRSRMADLGLTSAQVAGVLRTAVQGTVVSQFDRPDGTQSDVRLKLADADTMTPAQLGALPVFVPSTGQTVRLDQIATLRQATGPNQIDRASQQRRMSVSANVVGRSLGDVARDIQAQTSKLALPTGYRVLLLGQADRLNQAVGSLLGALGMSIVLIYMLLAALYEDWLHPLAIMFSLPLALVGAFTGLLVTGNTLNMFSMIGLIFLMGLVAKNAILLVDYTNTLRGRGVAQREAILEAGATRLRPILMTSFTLVFAMIPLAMKLEAGAESRSPLAVVIIGGVLSSMFLTLVVVPVVYALLEDLSGLVKNKSRQRVQREEHGRQAVRPALLGEGSRVHESPSSDFVSKP